MDHHGELRFCFYLEYGRRSSAGRRQKRHPIVERTRVPNQSCTIERFARIEREKNLYKCQNYVLMSPFFYQIFVFSQFKRPFDAKEKKTRYLTNGTSRAFLDFLRKLSINESTGKKTAGSKNMCASCTLREIFLNQEFLVFNFC